MGKIELLKMKNKKKKKKKKKNDDNNNFDDDHRKRNENIQVNRFIGFFFVVLFLILKILKIFN